MPLRWRSGKRWAMCCGARFSFDVPLMIGLSLRLLSFAYQSFRS
jgi:hypothetical protein